MNILPTFARHQFLPTRFGVAISILFGTAAAFQSASPVGIEEHTGLKWGYSMEKVRQIMGARPGVVNDAAVKRSLQGFPDQRLKFLGGEFENWKVDEWFLGFTDDKLCAVRVVIHKPVGEVSEAVAKYFDARKFLTEKYGTPSVAEDPTLNTFTQAFKQRLTKWSVRTGDHTQDATIWLEINNNSKKDVKPRVFIQFTNDQLASQTPSQPAATAPSAPAPAKTASAPAAPTPYRDSLAVAVGTGFATVKLKDGRTLQGDILTEDSEQFVLQTESPTGVTLSKFTLKKSDVATVDKWKRQQRLQSLRSMAKALQEQIKSCRDTSNQAAKEQADAERKAEHYRIYMAKTHGNSGTLTELQMNARSAKTKAATAEKQKQQLEAQKQAIEQKIAQVRD